jgi:hypothetical protein
MRTSNVALDVTRPQWAEQPKAPYTMKSIAPIHTLSLQYGHIDFLPTITQPRMHASCALEWGVGSTRHRKEGGSGPESPAITTSDVGAIRGNIQMYGSMARNSE